MVVAEPVGVARSARIFFGRTASPANSAAAGVGQQVIDVGDPAGGGQLERQQRQQPEMAGITGVPG